ncbi:asparagine synthase (glutamine-hydrolyzing) [Candidatus Levibacter sp. Uisw_134_01]|uniref:asparagine synthase (glutamine-hydrolyzing) n=1 Tax=Candidatus Levibacter sp. Uisw_134_01 TaxID=3230999 RepID=UPI003D517D66
MCGILGIARNIVETDKHWLKVGRDKISYRGPDDSGEWWSSDFCVGIAHRRLSIIEISRLGHQPMHLPKHGLSVVFNGEIYNHHILRKELVDLGFSFNSLSDTEVLMAAYAAWGEEFIGRLNGMFAFALYDARRRKLFLARDRAGEKPLFYRIVNGQLQFASELKALLANPKNPRCIDKEALDCYLAMGYVPGERCILDGYNKLPPAHFLRFDLQSGHHDIGCYWELPQFNYEKERLNEGNLLDELEVLMEDAVRGQMVADVPVGILLSGGIDSSLVTAMAARCSSRVQTFTVRFPGYNKLDETRHARLISDHFGTMHTELISDDVNIDLLPRLAHHFDEPIVDSSMIPTFLLSQLVRQHCSVALGGDGGDELFGGYGHYSRLQWMKKKLGWIPLSIRKGIAVSMEKILPVGFKGRNWLQGLSVDFEKGLPLIASYFDYTSRLQLLKPYANWPFIAELIRQQRVPSDPDLLQRATRMDFSNYLAEDILVKIDRSSMMNSLEIRAPLLDYRLIEFAFGKVSTNMKATSIDKKILLKKLCSRLLPSNFDMQRKQGFSIPLAEWLKRPKFNNFFNEVLRDPKCSFDPRAIESLFRGQKRGYSNSERLFSLVLFELWKKEFGVTF